MKRVLKFVAVLSVMVVTYACVELEPTPQFKESNETFEASANVNTLAAAADDSLENVITFSWNDPKYSVGLDQSKFAVQVGRTGGSFSRFLTKDFTGVLSGSLLGKEINGMALKLGGVIGQPIALDVRVIASQSNNNEPKSSTVIALTVTPYGDLAITPSDESVVLAAVTASEVGVSFSWTSAFNGFSGVKTYQLQYAPGGDAFVGATTVDISGFSKSFSQFDLNKLALVNGVSPGQEGTVDFRIKATNELGNVLYSNTATITIKTYIAFNSIGIIGDATAGSWGTDTDMYRPNPSTEPTKWYLVAYLIGGQPMKFRADDDWADNWGAATFPSGTGLQNGSNIPVTNSGYYKIDFNVATGAYSFTAFTPTVYTSMGIIGDGSGGWGDADEKDLTQDPNNVHLWTGTFTLTAAAVKFRANDGWTNNWGAAGFPSDFGVQNGPNIAVSAGGSYFVRFNDVTGEYFFGPADRSAPYLTLGLIGPATAGGWGGAQTALIRNPTDPFKWSGNIQLTDGEAKFRVDNSWAQNWGASTFPNGVGTSGGPNIPATAGKYTVTFNTLTGAYTFVK